MKWAIVGLTVLGIAAAACAALLVGAIRAGSLTGARAGKDLDGEVQVLYATRPLDAMTVVSGDMVATKSMPRSKAPPAFIADPVQVVGRVLTVPLLDQQAFSTSCFAAESNASLAAAVGKGKRAVGISVTDYAGLEGLLYPGSVVDVMVTLKPDMNSTTASLKSPLTTTILERVQVLAIERQTVVSGSSDKVGADVEVIGRSSATRRVTLLVDTKQAKTLQLAMEQGALSLALRNPLDTGDADKDRVSMRSMLGLGDEATPVNNKPGMLERMFDNAMKTGSKFADKMGAAQPIKNDPFAPDSHKAPSQWEVTVIRGDASKTYAFPSDGAKPVEQPGATAAGNDSPAKVEPKTSQPDQEPSSKDQAPAAAGKSAPVAQ